MPGQKAILHGYRVNDKFAVGECDETLDASDHSVYTVTDNMYDVQIQDTTTTKAADVITFASDSASQGLGSNTLQAGANEYIKFTNTPEKLFDFVLYKRGNDESSTTANIQFMNGIDSETGETIFQNYNGKYNLCETGKEPIEHETTDGNVTLSDGQ